MSRGLIVMLTLSWLFTAAGCSLKQTISTCEPVPDWLLSLPDKPSANLPKHPKNRDVVRVIEEQDRAHDQARGQIEGIRVQQAGCK